MHLEKICK
jgi:putative pectin methyltransferase